MTKQTFTKKDIQWALQLRNDMFFFGDADPAAFEYEDLIKVLRIADDQYHNHEATSPLTDDEYDSIRRYCELTDPNHNYFLGIGAEVRGGKVKLPYTMGSLDQVYEGEIEKWVREKRLTNENVIITEKLDGTSALLIYDSSGHLQIAFSRGDGVQGADITRHIRRIPSVPKNIARDRVVRGEVIISKLNFPRAQAAVKTRGGKEYKNARNMVAGLMNASENDPAVYQFISFVAYAIIDTPMNKIHMFDELVDAGFHIPAGVAGERGRDLNDELLAAHVSRMRKESRYEIDGIVLDVDSLQTRERLVPSRDTLNPAFAIKYKVADASNLAIATVIEVEWNVSKHGYLKPRVKIEPVELVGVTVQHATGFNAKFIHDNKIGPGAKVRVSRMGDVIPNIIGVVEPAKWAQMPSIDWAWNETEVDATVATESEAREIKVLQLVDFFSSIKAPHLKEGNVREMFERSTFDTVEEYMTTFIAFDQVDWVEGVGANGMKIYDGLREKLSNIPLHVLAGASPFFGRGVGVRKMKKLVSGIGITEPSHFITLSVTQIVRVEGFDEKTAHKIIAGIPQFVAWYETVKDHISITQSSVQEGGVMENEKVVFTGFRDADLEAAVEAAGGTMQSGVSSKTTILVCVDPNSNTGKAKKARDLGVRVIGLDNFKEMLE